MGESVLWTPFKDIQLQRKEKTIVLGNYFYDFLYEVVGLKVGFQCASLRTVHSLIPLAPAFPGEDGCLKDTDFN